MSKADLELDDGTFGSPDVAVVAGGEKVLVSKRTAHSVGVDGPWIIAFHEIAAIDNAFILAYPFFIFFFVGWAWGSALIFGFGIVSFYLTWCLAGLHEYGGKRNIRFRDLTAAILGSWAYYPTLILQFSNLIFGNIGLVILAGQSLKAVHDLYSDNQNIKLTEWSAITGAVCTVFTFFMPHLTHLKAYSGISILLISLFAGIAIVISIKDGINNPSGEPSYELEGNVTEKVFNALGVIGTVAFSYNNVILPEIQATARAPAIKNMRKAIGIVYAFGMSLWIVMAYIGYWAYGNGVTPNLLINLSGPKWAITLAWVAAWTQTIVSLQIYGAPMYEMCDTYFYKDGGDWTVHNMILRFFSRGLYWALTTFVAMLLPYFGDFVPLAGASSAFPLVFAGTLAMTAIAYKDTMHPVRKGLHWIGVVVSMMMGLAALIAAVRYIVVDAVNYRVFANLAG